MGLNLVIGCRKHRVRRWISRGDEREGVVGFYHEHWRCQLNTPGTIVLSDDQSSDDWLEDPTYSHESFPDDAVKRDAPSGMARLRAEARRSETAAKAMLPAVDDL